MSYAPDADAHPGGIGDGARFNQPERHRAEQGVAGDERRGADDACGRRAQQTVEAEYD